MRTRDGQPLTDEQQKTLLEAICKMELLLHKGAPSQRRAIAYLEVLVDQDAMRYETVLRAMTLALRQEREFPPPAVILTYPMRPE